MGQRKITSVIDLAKYKVGTTLYWVVFRPTAPEISIPEGEEWMRNTHAKVFFDRGLAQWPFGGPIPRLHGVDFRTVIDLLISEPIVEPFVVVDITRCTDTGEFYYQDQYDNWMPESALIPTIAEAKQEKANLKKLIAVWTRSQAADAV